MCSALTIEITTFWFLFPDCSSSSFKEKRVVTKKGSGDVIPKGVQNQEDVSNIFSAGRGKRRQILVTAPGNTKASLALGPYKCV